MRKKKSSMFKLLLQFFYTQKYILHFTKSSTKKTDIFFLNIILENHWVYFSTWVFLNFLPSLSSIASYILYKKSPWSCNCNLQGVEQYKKNWVCDFSYNFSPITNDFSSREKKLNSFDEFQNFLHVARYFVVGAWRLEQIWEFFQQNCSIKIWWNIFLWFVAAVEELQFSPYKVT